MASGVAEEVYAVPIGRDTRTEVTVKMGMEGINGHLFQLSGVEASDGGIAVLMDNNGRPRFASKEAWIAWANERLEEAGSTVVCSAIPNGVHFDDPEHTLTTDIDYVNDDWKWSTTPDSHPGRFYMNGSLPDVSNEFKGDTLGYIEALPDPDERETLFKAVDDALIAMYNDIKASTDAGMSYTGSSSVASRWTELKEYALMPFTQSFFDGMAMVDWDDPDWAPWGLVSDYIETQAWSQTKEAKYFGRRWNKNLSLLGVSYNKVWVAGYTRPEPSWYYNVYTTYVGLYGLRTLTFTYDFLRKIISHADNVIAAIRAIGDRILSYGSNYEIVANAYQYIADRYEEYLQITLSEDVINAARTGEAGGVDIIPIVRTIDERTTYRVIDDTFEPDTIDETAFALTTQAAFLPSQLPRNVHGVIAYLRILAQAYAAEGMSWWIGQTSNPVAPVNTIYLLDHDKDWVAATAAWPRGGSFPCITMSRYEDYCVSPGVLIGAITYKGCDKVLRRSDGVTLFGTVSGSGTGTLTLNSVRVELHVERDGTITGYRAVAMSKLSSAVTVTFTCEEASGTVTLPANTAINTIVNGTVAQGGTAHIGTDTTGSDGSEVTYTWTGGIAKTTTTRVKADGWVAQGIETGITSVLSNNYVSWDMRGGDNGTGVDITVSRTGTVTATGRVDVTITNNTDSIATFTISMGEYRLYVSGNYSVQLYGGSVSGTVAPRSTGTIKKSASVGSNTFSSPSNPGTMSCRASSYGLRVTITGSFGTAYTYTWAPTFSLPLNSNNSVTGHSNIADTDTWRAPENTYTYTYKARNMIVTDHRTKAWPRIAGYGVDEKELLRNYIYDMSASLSGVFGLLPSCILNVQDYASDITPAGYALASLSEPLSGVAGATMGTYDLLYALSQSNSKAAYDDAISQYLPDDGAYCIGDNDVITGIYPVIGMQLGDWTLSQDKVDPKDLPVSQTLEYEEEYDTGEVDDDGNPIIDVRTVQTTVPLMTTQEDDDGEPVNVRKVVYAYGKFVFPDNWASLSSAIDTFKSVRQTYYADATTELGAYAAQVEAALEGILNYWKCTTNTTTWTFSLPNGQAQYFKALRNALSGMGTVLYE